MDRATEWESELADIERFVHEDAEDAAAIQRELQRIRRMRDVVHGARQQADRDQVAAQRVLGALGDPPAVGEPPETAEMLRRRDVYTRQLAQARDRLAEIDLTLARADELESRLTTRRREEATQVLRTRHLAPWRIGVVREALTEASQRARAELIPEPQAMERLVSAHRGRGLYLPSLALAIGGFLIGFQVRRWLLRRFGRDPTVTEPTYTRRFVGAAAEGVARGIIPAGIILGLLAWILGADTPLDEGLTRAIIGALVSLLVYVLIVVFPRTLLAPDLPQWRIVNASPDNARAISRRVALVAVFLAIAVFVDAVLRPGVDTPNLHSVLWFLYVVGQAIALVLLTQERLWRRDGEAQTGVAGEGDSAEATAASSQRLGAWYLLRWAVRLIAVAAVAAVFAGYILLGAHLMVALLSTLVIIGVLVLLRALLHEGLNVLVESHVLDGRGPNMERGLRQARFWSRALVDPLLVVVGVVVVLGAWGLPGDDVLTWVHRTATGVEVGSITVSILDILLAIGVFVAVMFLTGYLRRGYFDRLLADTRIDTGVQQSMSTGVRYVGVLVAFALSVAVLGVSFTNIAIILGALSLGIGFGLQNIVNNFVSGMILLAERPIKIGDWVIVGNNEGYVQQINFRSTELQTFQRASVIIPNADLLSQPVVNLTHGDRYGRVELRVGVAYGSDVPKVRALLLEAAHAHSSVLAYPAPVVYFRDFGDSALIFDLYAYTADVTLRLRIASDLRFLLDRRFAEEGVEIPFPQRVVHWAGDTPKSGPGRAAETQGAEEPGSTAGPAST